jgi:hypothetical protein
MRPNHKVIYSSRTADKFVLRLPDGMREVLAECARGSHRSMNSEMIARLEASIMEDQKKNNPAINIDVESGQSMPVVDAWTPRTGMLVCYRLDIKKVGVILDFDQADDGTIWVDLDLLDGNKPSAPISHLQPFVCT